MRFVPRDEIGRVEGPSRSTMEENCTKQGAAAKNAWRHRSATWPSEFLGIILKSLHSRCVRDGTLARTTGDARTRPHHEGLRTVQARYPRPLFAEALNGTICARVALS